MEEGKGKCEVLLKLSRTSEGKQECQARKGGERPLQLETNRVREVRWSRHAKAASKPALGAQASACTYTGVTTEVLTG